MAPLPPVTPMCMSRRCIMVLFCLLAAILSVGAYAQEPPARAPNDSPTPPTSRPASAPIPRGPGARMTGLGMVPPAPTLGEGPTCAFDSTVYEVHMPADQIGRLDADALTRSAADAAAFEKALAAVGASRPLYRVHQSVRLGGDSILVGTAAPQVTSSSPNSRGDLITSVTYQQVGAAFSIAGKTGAAGAIELDLRIQVSALSDGVPLNANVKAPVFRMSQMVHKGEVKANQPFVLISADAASTDPDGKAVAYITRVTLGEPHLTPTTSPPRKE